MTQYATQCLNERMLTVTGTGKGEGVKWLELSYTACRKTTLESIWHDLLELNLRIEPAEMYTYVYQKSLSYICNENYYIYLPLRQEADTKHILTVKKLETIQVYAHQSRRNNVLWNMNIMEQYTEKKYNYEYNTDTFYR